MQRRIINKNMEIVHSFIPIAHDNSSTLKNGFQKKMYFKSIRYIEFIYAVVVSNVRIHSKCFLLLKCSCL